MKKILTLVVCLGLVFATLVPSYAEENSESIQKSEFEVGEVLSLTLDEAIKIGFEKNADLEIAKLELEKAEVVYKREIRDVRDMERNVDLIFSRDPITGYRAEDAAINKVLVKNGAMRRTVELNHNAAIWNVAISENGLTYKIKKSYYDTALAYAQLEIARQNLELSKKQLSNGELRLSVGMISKQQLLGLQLSLSQAQSQLDGATLAFELQAMSFKNLIGLPMDTQIFLSDPIAISSYEPIDIDKSISESNENNAMLKMSRERSELSELNFEAIKVKYPDITYRYREEALVVANAKRSAEQVRTAVEMGVRSAYLNLITAEKQIATFKLAVQQATEALRIAELSFELGQNTPTEIAQANINLMNAKKSLAQQIHAYNLALLDYKYSVGIGKGL